MSGQELPSGASVVIVGAGVTGLSTAWWLARSGVSVVVLDKGVIGMEASGRNGGGCSHYQSPLFAEEQRLWPMMDELLGYPTEHRSGKIIFGITEQQVDYYKYIAKCIRAHGARVDDLNGDDIRRLVPLAGDNALAGFRAYTGGQANPQRTVQAYAWALRDHGGQVFQHTPAIGFERAAGGRVLSVITPRGTIGCDHVLLASGPNLPQLAALLDIDVPAAPARAEMIVTEPCPLMDLRGVDGNGLYGRQTARGNLAYGGGPHEWMPDLEPDGPKARPTTPLVRNLAARVAGLFPKAAHLRVIRSWAGVVETTPDGRPILDRLEHPGNVTIATMSGVGFGLSPASGHALRDLIVDGECSFADISKLRLSRFDGLDPDWRRQKGWIHAVAQEFTGEAALAS